MRPIGSHHPSEMTPARPLAHRRRWRSGMTALVVGALVIAACSSDKKAATVPGSTVAGGVATTPAGSASGSTAPTGAATVSTVAGTSTTGTSALSIAANSAPGSATANTKAPSGTLVVDVSTLGTENFIVALGHEEDSTYTSLINEPLVYLKHDTLDFMPGLATSWSVTPDGLTWTFKLRDGVHFHNPDGSDAGAFTSADVQFTVQTAMGPNSNWYALNTYKQILKSVDTPDPLTVVFNLNAPYPGLIADVSSSVGALEIQSKAHVEAVGVEKALTQPVGTGPYVLKSQQRGSSMTLEALPQHWRVVPEYKTITLNLVPEESTRVANLKAGTGDIVQLSGAALKTLDSDTKTQQIPDAWTSFLSFGGLYFDRPQYKDVPYADVRVRKAMALAIDRNAIAKTLYGGAATPASGWGLYPFSGELTAPGYDPAQAKELLKAANWPADYVMDMWVQASPQLGDVQTLTEAIAAMFSAVGIKTKIEPIDAATAQQKYQAFDVSGVITASAGRQWFDPQPAWQVLFHSGSLYESFYSKEMDAMIDDLAKTIDPDQRITKEKAIQHYMIDDQMVVVPLVTGTSVYGLSKNVGTWTALRGTLPLYLEYVTHPTPIGTFRLFEP